MKNTDDKFRQSIFPLDDFSAYLEKLEPYDELTGVFYQVVSALAEATKNNYLLLQGSLDIDYQPDAAWACRNLLEIKIITKYVLSSEANLNNFVEDRLLDGLDLTKALKNLHISIDPCFDVTTLNDVINEYELQKSSEGIERTKYISTKEMAEKVGLEKEYESVNKICSKLVHPTAWSLITSYTAATRFPEASTLFDRLGSSYQKEIVLQMEEHIKKYGLRNKTV